MNLTFDSEEHRTLLSRARLGDSVEIYLGPSNRPADTSTNLMMIGTAIGKYNDGIFMLGWKNVGPRPSKIDPVDFLSPPQQKHRDFNKYAYACLWGRCTGSLIISALAHAVYPEFDGCVCRECKEPYYMAGPNQTDGTFVCRLCKANPWRNYRK